jgi:hypothetical protein
MDKNNQLQIRNSTVDFLIFTRQNGEEGITVRVKDENVWLMSETIAMLFQKDRRTIQEHLKNIFLSGELIENSVCRKFRHTATDGKNYQVKFYNLEAIISVGYKADSQRAIEFRKWATTILSNFAKKGYVLDKNRLINDQTDSQTTKEFFAHVQNKLHFSIHQNTAAELIMKRANAQKENMGLTNWKNSPHGKIIKTDVSVAKNYLSKLELSELNEIVTMYLDYANRQARKFIPMTMNDWKVKLDVFLKFNDESIGDGIGSVSHEIAKAFAESEFEKYRVIQDKTYRSDFDKLVKQAKALNPKTC